VDNAFINNSGTAKLATGTGEVTLLELGSTAGSSGTFLVTGGDFTAYDRIHIGEVGSGTATFSGGTIQTPFNEQDIFVGGENSGGTGILTVSGASTFVKASDDVGIGRTGNGTLNFQGGRMMGGYTFLGKFGTGVWNHSGGVYQQDFGDIEIGDGGRPDQAGIPGPRTGTINLAGGVIQGAGHLALGNRNGTGTVNISGGALALTGAVGDGSIIIGRGMDWEASPGAGGPTELRVKGDNSIIVANGKLLMNPASVASSSTLIEEITGTTQTPIKVVGDADITKGKLKVVLNGYVPVSGNNWTIVEAGADISAQLTAIDSLVSAGGYPALTHAPPATVGSLIGPFASTDFSLAPLSPGLSWNVQYVGNTVQLKVIGLAGITGDYNNNGKVDAADYVLWRHGGPLQNDPTPGVQPADYGVWRANFGQGSGAAAGLSSAQAVPEPSAVLLLAMAVSITYGIKRGRSVKFV